MGRPLAQRRDRPACSTISHPVPVLPPMPIAVPRVRLTSVRSITSMRSLTRPGITGPEAESTRSRVPALSTVHARRLQRNDVHATWAEPRRHCRESDQQRPIARIGRMRGLSHRWRLSPPTVPTGWCRIVPDPAHRSLDNGPAAAAATPLKVRKRSFVHRMFTGSPLRCRSLPSGD